MGGGTDGIVYEWGSVWMHDGYRNVLCVNSDDGKRKLNVNWNDNDWNGYWRFPARRNALHALSSLRTNIGGIDVY